MDDDDEGEDAKSKRKAEPKTKKLKRSKCDSYQEDSMPSGVFWKVIKSEKQQALFECRYKECGKGKLKQQRLILCI